MNRAAVDRRLRLGFVADGIFKVITAAGVVVVLPRLTDRLDVAPWLVLVTAAALVVCGAHEVAFSSRSSDPRPHIKYLVAYDAGWLIVTALAVGLVRDGAGELWFAYQALGSAALALVFARAGTSATSRR
jgi:hypothetical protein